MQYISTTGCQSCICVFSWAAFKWEEGSVASLLKVQESSLEVCVAWIHHIYLLSFPHHDAIFLFNMLIHPLHISENRTAPLGLHCRAAWVNRMKAAQYVYSMCLNQSSWIYCKSTASLPGVCSHFEKVHVVLCRLCCSVHLTAHETF